MGPPIFINHNDFIARGFEGNRETPSNRNVEYRVLTGLGKAE